MLYHREDYGTVRSYFTGTGGKVVKPPMVTKTSFRKINYSHPVNYLPGVGPSETAEINRSIGAIGGGRDIRGVVYGSTRDLKWFADQLEDARKRNSPQNIYFSGAVPPYISTAVEIVIKENRNSVIEGIKSGLNTMHGGIRDFAKNAIVFFSASLDSIKNLASSVSICK